MFKEIIVIGLIIGVAVFGFFLYQNNWDFTATTSQITGMISKVSDNDATAPVLSLLGGVGSTAAIARFAYDGLKKEATQKIDEQNNLIVDKNTELQALKGTYDSKIESLETKISELQAENPDLDLLKGQLLEQENIVKDLRSQNEGLQEMHQNFVNKLASASNNDTVLDSATGTVYKVIKITSTQVL